MKATASPFNARRPRLLDLFCGAGGAGVGYARAGFEAVGVDIARQPRYPFAFRQGDAISALERALWYRDSGRRALDFDLADFDAIHASPPCQRYTNLVKREYPDLIAPIRDLLEATGLPYVIENVPGAPLKDPVRLCGSMFGLDVRRHRLFETNWPLGQPDCRHSRQTPRFRSLDKKMADAGRLASVVGVHGHINYAGEFELRCKAMDIDWMTNDELVEAIPPAYTEFIGEALQVAMDRDEVPNAA